MDDAKIYNVCLMRVKHQIVNAAQKLSESPYGRVILESYNTGDPEEIIDILEIYDIEDRSSAGLREKLDDLAYTVSMLVKDRIAFGYDDRGNLGLYLMRKERLGEEYIESDAVLAAA